MNRFICLSTKYVKASEKYLFKKHLYCKYYLENQSYEKKHRTQTRAYFVLLGLLTAYAEITEKKSYIMQTKKSRL